MTEDELQQLLERAENWARMDPNATTSSHVQKLIEAVGTEEVDATSYCALETLRLWFPLDGSRIEFGTAGLRATMKPGPLGMNDLVVLQTAQGLAAYIAQQQDSAKNLVAVVGYDHRDNPQLQISSKSLAILTMAVFKQAGIQCFLFHDFIPTPFIAFATRYLHADLGIMVTASHNPKIDNGYKVYGSDGCQIRPPLDKDIQQSILQNLNPWAQYPMNIDDEDTSTFTSKDLADAYYDALSHSGLITGLRINKNSVHPHVYPKIVYTAMHGVGYPWAKRTMETFSLPPLLSVPDQEQPDPFFTTVPFPNPEEKGALNRAFQYALDKDASIVVANDPDADRLAVAERTGCSHNHAWTTFTGDQIGTMLGHWLWEQIGKNSSRVG